MAVRIDLTLDCENATRLADFWKLALGYEDEPPPAPFATRQEWLAAVDPGGEGDPDDGAWLHDPDGVGPRLSVLRVPEPKRAKNRLHLDLRVAGPGTPEERWSRITREVDRLTVRSSPARSGRRVRWSNHLQVRRPRTRPAGDGWCGSVGSAGRSDWVDGPVPRYTWRSRT
jgi:hypothetical protein